MTLDFYKNFVLLAVLSYWPAAIYIVRKWPNGRHITFSQHAASNKKASLIFGIAITLETSFYTLFLYRWFIPTFHMGMLFKVLVAIILVLHLMAGLVPETKGLAKKTHRFVAYAATWLFLPTQFILTITSTIPLLARIVSASFFVILCASCVLYLTTPRAREVKLLIQTACIAALPITLIAATYLK